MFGQKTVDRHNEGNGRQASQNSARGGDVPPADALGRSVNDFKHNLVTLVELQAKLLGADLQSSVSKARRPAIVLAVALGLLLGGVPLVLAALTFGLTAVTGWPLGVSAAVSGSLAIVAAGGLAWFAWDQLRNCGNVFERSRAELAENVRWLKSALRPEKRTGQDRE